MKKMLILLLLVLYIFSGLVFAETGKRKDKEIDKIEWPEIPLKTQKTISEHLQDGTISKLKKQKIIQMVDKQRGDKKDIYLAEIKKANGKKFWVTVDHNGQLIDVETEETENLPEDEENQRKERKHSKKKD